MDFFDFVNMSGDAEEIKRLLRSSSGKITGIHDQFKAECVSEFMEMMNDLEGAKALCSLREMIWDVGGKSLEDGNTAVSYMAKLSWLGFLTGFQGAMEEIMLKREEEQL